MNRLVTVFLAICWFASASVLVAQEQPSLKSLDELQLSRALLSDLQDAVGPMDARLIEPIEQLADRLIDLNQFDEAHALLDRAMQITRIEDGLYTAFQRPLLSKKIDNFANRGDWESARQHMQHLLWLYTEKSKIIDEALVEDLLQLSRIHLRALVEDGRSWQGYHFRQSAQIRWLALGVAGTIWGATDPRLPPIIYEQLKQFHLQTVALWEGGSTGYSLRELAPGSDILRDRSAVNETFYFTGLALLNNLHAIYEVEQAVNLEGMAMSDLYLADWQILYDQPETAIATYQLAYQGMLSAGVDPALIDELFSQPLILPEAEFYPTVEQAVLARRSAVEIAEEGSDPYLSFREWSTALPNVSSPVGDFVAQDQGEELDSNFALFSFSLAGVNKVSNWYSHRYTSTVSMIEQAELLTHFLDFRPQERRLLEKLNKLKFRPKLVEGQPQQANGILKYRLAEGTSVKTMEP